MIQALERPATTASATKSCSLIASVSPRTWRAKRGQSSSAMTSTTLRKLGSDTATITTAMRIVGSERPMSVSRMSTASVRPPRYPETRPSSVPSVPATPMATSETTSEIRLPQMMRLSTSRPKRSVPSGCSGSPRSIQMGGIDFLTRSPSVGLWGARYGANSAVTTSAPRMRPANQGSCRLRGVMTNPRVEIAVEQVHAQVAGEIEGTQHQHARLHDRVVARGDRLEDQPAQSRPREHGLGDDGAAQELHEEQDGEGDDRKQRVPQAVLPEHHLLVQTLEPRELDVVRAEHLQHRRARETQDRGRGEVAQREGGEDQMQGSAAAAGRQHPQHDTEEQDQHESEPERGHGLTEHGEHARRGVQHAAAAHRRVHPERDADEHAQEHRHEAQLHRRGQPLPDVLGDRPPGDDRVPEIAHGDVHHVDAVLDGQRLVEAEMARQDLLIALRRVDVQQQVDRIAGQAGEHEDDADHHEHAQHRLKRPPDEIARHLSVGGSGAAPPDTPHRSCAASSAQGRLRGQSPRSKRARRPRFVAPSRYFRVTYSQLWKPMWPAINGHSPTFGPTPAMAWAAPMATPGM